VDDYFGARAENSSVGAIPPRPDERTASRLQIEAATERCQSELHGLYQPLPDEWLNQALPRISFYLEEVGPNLLRVSSDWAAVQSVGQYQAAARGSGQVGKAYADERRGLAWQAYLESFDWVTSDGRPMRELPFDRDGLQFPPINFSDLLDLFRHLQESALQVVLLLSAGRVGEALSVSRTAIEAAPGGGGASYALIEGRTYKPSPHSVGERKVWPVPQKVLEWLKQQAEITGALGSDPSSDALWISLGTREFGAARIEAGYHVARFTRRHGLGPFVGEGGRVHPHRFRKTIARLAVLALHGGPMALMVLLGHKDMVTVLRYALSSPTMRQEMRELITDIRFELLEEISDGLDEAGSPGAETLRRAREKFFDEIQVPANERVQQRRQREFLAAVLAEDIDAKIVFPGVVCIKPLETAGKCSSAGREPNPSLCQSDCVHRIDLPRRKSEVRAIIEQCLDDLDAPEVRDNLLHRRFMVSQLIDHLHIFDDVREEYSRSPRVRDALDGTTLVN
jgi:integrase